jgi:hypothetical protein
MVRRNGEEEAACVDMAGLVKTGGHGKPWVFHQQHGTAFDGAWILRKTRALQRCCALAVPNLSLQKVFRVFRHEINFFTMEPEFICRNNAIL